MLKKRNIFFLGLCVALALMLTGCSSVNQPTAVMEDHNQVFHPGKFVWHELWTDDVDSIKEFYGQLLNWTFKEYKEDTTIILLNNKPIGTIVDTKGSETKGVKWVSYLSVSDIDNAMELLVSEGGRIHEGPREIKGVGHIVLASDPHGAKISLIRTFKGDPADVEVSEGLWLWHELWTNTPKEAINFYKQLGNYSNVEELHSYWILQQGGKWRGGIRHLVKPSFQQRWVPVIKVLDVEAISSLAKVLGGRVIIEPKNPDYIDEVALLKDPSGAFFMIQEWTEIDEELFLEEMEEK